MTFLDKKPDPEVEFAAEIKAAEVELAEKPEPVSEPNDFAEASFSLDLQGITLTAWVSAADTVSVRFQNETTGNVNLASGTLRARVRKL